MCTLTLVSLGRENAAGAARRRFRLAFNRDEQRTRPPGLPPTTRRCGERLAAMPIDPVGGGTWIGVNDAGLVACLLNRNVGQFAPPASPRSRGLIVPKLLACASAEEVRHAVGELKPADYAPFRAMCCDGGRLTVATSDGRSVEIESTSWDGSPFFMTSSGLGDSWVERPRRELFDRMFATVGGAADVQDAFHRHRWPDRPHLSVDMAREDAVTVSHTIVEVGGGEAVLRHWPTRPSDISRDQMIVATLPLWSQDDNAVNR
jgi:hypothetical protein